METSLVSAIELNIRVKSGRCYDAILTVLVALMIVSVVGSGTLNAQPSKKKKKGNGFHLSVDSTVHFTPSRTFGPNTVGGYFFPAIPGASWTLLTTQVLLNDSGKVVRRDSIYNRERVVDTARFSLQRLPLMACRDYSWRPGSKDTVKSESFYYVDDSVAMTVFNNSVSHQMNRVFLVSPLEIGNHWHDQYGDSISTFIAGYVDSVITPMGRTDSVLVTLTQMQASDLRKFFARGKGIIKTLYRAQGPGGHGIVIVTTEMTECILPSKQ